MVEEVKIIAGRKCHLVSQQQPPEVLLVKPLGSFEYRCLMQECQLLESMVAQPFAMCAFEVENMDSFRQPDHETLTFLTNDLVPSLHEQFGSRPLVLGGYSLGGLFALWSSSRTQAFDAVAACSPSLWADWWAEYAQEHPSLSKFVYLSLGDTEENTRKQPFCRMGDSLRSQHQLNLLQKGESHCVLEWNKGGHFADIEQRKAKGFAWCINKLFGDW